jgi:NADH-quinone oxidoreductase subunit E
MNEDFIQETITKYDGDEGMLIPMLQDIQQSEGYLPQDMLRGLAKGLDLPLMRLYSVATFYKSFRLAPKGQHEITLCMGTVCYLKGAGKISEVICEKYSVEPGGTTEDRLFTLLAVNCVGACALAPVMIVDGKYYDGVSPESALGIIKELETEPEVAAAEA